MAMFRNLSISRRSTRFFSLWLTLAAIIAGFAALGSGARAGQQLPTGTGAGDMDLSPFYRWKDVLPEKPGAALREERIASPKEIDRAIVSVRTLYSSTDARWNSGPIAVSGIMYLPAGTPPAGGWPVLAWGHGTMGIADICAPSWNGHRDRDATYLNRWLKAGFAVVATDYQGLGGPGPHPYLYWQAEGRSILDSVRAAIATRPGLISNRVIIAGQSQGGGSALGAARIAREYAPDLDVRGIVATAPNSTFPDGPVALPVRNSNNMFFSFASGGLRDDAPNIDDILSPRGRQLLEASRRGCTRDVGMLSRQLKVASLADTLSISMDQLAAARIPVTDMPMGAMKIPLMVATGLADDTVEPLRQYAVASALCASGNNVTWRTYPGLSHDGVLNGSFDDSLVFARALLAGEKVTGNCARITRPGEPEVPTKGIPFND